MKKEGVIIIMCFSVSVRSVRSKKMLKSYDLRRRVMS
jgi:hypothetical protein